MSRYTLLLAAHRSFSGIFLAGPKVSEDFILDHNLEGALLLQAEVELHRGLYDKSFRWRTFQFRVVRARIHSDFEEEFVGEETLWEGERLPAEKLLPGIRRFVATNADKLKQALGANMNYITEYGLDMISRYPDWGRISSEPLDWHEVALWWSAQKTVPT